MDLDLTEEQKMFWESIADFCDHETAPLVDEAEAKEEFPLPLFKNLGTLRVLKVWRDSRVLSTTEGTSEIQHLIIAGELKL